jgi:hypothetical protein
MVGTLLAGESIGLFGLRRTGKSSSLLEVQGALKAAGRTPIYVDVQGSDRIEPILAALLGAIPHNHIGHKVTTALSGSKVNKVIDLLNRIRGKERPAPLSPREVLHHVELMKGDLVQMVAAQQSALVLMIDELPYLIIHMLDGGLKVPEVNSFLATLRSWRQDGHLPMVLSGSIGLQQLIRERGVARENFNDLVFQPTPPPLTSQEAKLMLRALAAGADCDWIDDAVIDAILTETAANYPSFLQFAFGRIKDHNARTPAQVSRIFELHVRPGLDKDFYNQFDTRMARYDAAMVSAARAVFRCLDNSVTDGIGLGEIDNVFASHELSARDNLLISLVEDGFIFVDTKTGAVTFSSPLVHAWWQSKPYRRKG